MRISAFLFQNFSLRLIRIFIISKFICYNSYVAESNEAEWNIFIFKLEFLFKQI